MIAMIFQVMTHYHVLIQMLISISVLPNSGFSYQSEADRLIVPALPFTRDQSVSQWSRSDLHDADLEE